MERGEDSDLTDVTTGEQYRLQGRLLFTAMEEGLCGIAAAWETAIETTARDPLQRCSCYGGDGDFSGYGGDGDFFAAEEPRCRGVDGGDVDFSGYTAVVATSLQRSGGGGGAAISRGWRGQ